MTSKTTSETRPPRGEYYVVDTDPKELYPNALDAIHRSVSLDTSEPSRSHGIWRILVAEWEPEPNMTRV